MEQHLGETRLADGTPIAYAVSGTGPPLVVVPGWVSHVELGWAVAPERGFFQALSEGRTLVRYDRPGSGLSGASAGRDLIELEDEVIAAVARELDLTRFDIFGSSLAAGLAVRWAARRPDTVDHLIVYGSWVDGAELATPEMQRTLLGMIKQHWGLGSEVITGIFAPEADASFRAGFAEHQRMSATAEEAGRALAACYSIDIRDELALVRADTTVIHRESDRAAPLSGARTLARGISGSEFVVLPGQSHIPFAGDAEGLIAVIRRSLGLPASRSRPRQPLTARQLEVAALVADGHSNRDIAQRLVITERSAESHVERIRQRLGFRSRTQVATWYVTNFAEER